jgi:hypothetical protein
MMTYAAEMARTGAIPGAFLPDCGNRLMGE